MDDAMMDSRVDPSVDPPKRRRAHHKSRMGCLECKRRHIKCDERRPTCSNCDIAARTCRYTVFIAVSRDTTSDSSAGSPTPAPTSTAVSPEPALLLSLPRSTTGRDNGHGHCFTFQHLLLLHHVESGMKDWLWVTEPIRDLPDVYLGGALASPFVMDLLLALSAQHLCTVHRCLRDQYRCLADDLQTRALAGFKAAAEDPSRQALVNRFLFSSLMALSAMAAMVPPSPYSNIDHLLFSFDEYLRVTRGVRIVGDAAWAEIHQSELGWIFSSFSRYEDYHGEPLPPFLTGVAQMLRRPDLDAAAAETCSEAVRCLGFILKQLDSSTSWGVHAVMAWANLTDPAYNQLLADRSPEALVILAHYAALLYQHRQFWVFGDLGENLLVGIARSIAPEWLSYLAKPLEVLSPEPLGRGPP